MKAYITVVTNMNYIKGVKILKKSLDCVDSQYPFLYWYPTLQNRN